MLIHFDVSWIQRQWPLQWISFVQKLFSACEDSLCEDECNRQYLEECSYFCPCHLNCANGCSCPPANELGNSYCPNSVPKPNPECLEDLDNQSLWKQCRNQCTDAAYICFQKCYGDKDCEQICRANDIECISYCPCYDNCPDGCPCPNWCDDENISLPEKCDLIWGEQGIKLIYPVLIFLKDDF